MATPDDISKRITDRMESRKAGGDTGGDGEGATADKGGSYDTVKQDALDEMTSILGLGGKDAERFGRAMSDWMKACMDAEDTDETTEDAGDAAAE